MSNAVRAGRDSVGNASTRNRATAFSGRDDLADYCMRLIQESDRHEAARRRFDRIGGNLYYSRHWNVPMPQGRSALTCNITKPLIDHKIAIMTKQQPVPVVECADGGDPVAARWMRSSIMDWWDRRDMQTKLEQAELLGACTRTSAIKYIIDHSLLDGKGDIDADVIPGWRLIIDPLARDRKAVRYIGDRALMPRWRAMRLYPAAAEEIANATAPEGFETGGSAQSPIKDPWSRLMSIYPGVASIDGLWTAVGYSSTGINGTTSGPELVEVVELYLKDPTMVSVTRPKLDDEGQKVQRVARGDDGAPRFEQFGHASYALEDGSIGYVPRWKIMLEDELEDVDVRKYPWYRRVTLLLPDMLVIDDTAWDFPHPYSLHGDGEVLEGLWKKGVALECEDLQAQLNVSLSLMTDNLRFSSHRVAVAYSGAQLERNSLTISPGDVLNVMGDNGSVQFLDFPQLSPAWFEWIKNIVGMMQQIVGVTGVMQGEAAGRVDSAEGYDLLAEIAGSRLTKDTQRMERAIADGMEIVGAMMQQIYTRAHGVAVADQDGNVSYQRVLPTTLQGAFRYKVLTGSTLAWTESARRKRVIEEFQQGFRDKISVWQELNIPGWRDIAARMAKEGAPISPPPPPRTRQNVSKKGVAHAPVSHG
ncbi:MAG: hypothetical protein KGL39_32595 [Patescibacteria group bacterium]|nr:hypothetical protein [Patescibacteria group bacterium]